MNIGNIIKINREGLVHHGQEGTIVQIMNVKDYPVLVKFDDGTKVPYNYDELIVQEKPSQIIEPSKGNTINMTGMYWKMLPEKQLAKMHQEDINAQCGWKPIEVLIFKSDLEMLGYVKKEE